MTHSHRFYSACIYVFLVTALACARQQSGTSAQATPESAPANNAPAVSATVTLAPTQGNQASGTATFTEESNGVRVAVEMSGLSPGDHGIHVHENGDCGSPDASSAGSHYNPTTMSHGGPDSPQHHVGDLGNITADADGHAKLDRVFPGLKLEGAQSLIGHALVVHSGRDDLASQPAGDSGSRIACGVIAAR